MGDGLGKTEIGRTVANKDLLAAEFDEEMLRVYQGAGSDAGYKPFLFEGDQQDPAKNDFLPSI